MTALPDDPFGWTIYRQPTDYPHGYIARRWFYGRGPDPVMTDDTITDEDLDRLRGKVLQRMNAAGVSPACFTRSVKDDPVIVESWL